MRPILKADRGKICYVTFLQIPNSFCHEMRKELDYCSIYCIFDILKYMSFHTWSLHLHRWTVEESGGGEGFNLASIFSQMYLQLSIFIH